MAHNLVDEILPGANRNNFWVGHFDISELIEMDFSDNNVGSSITVLGDIATQNASNDVDGFFIVPDVSDDVGSDDFKSIGSRSLF